MSVSVCLSVCLPVILSVRLSAYLSGCLYSSFCWATSSGSSRICRGKPSRTSRTLIQKNTKNNQYQPSSSEQMLNSRHSSSIASLFPMACVLGVALAILRNSSSSSDTILHSTHPSPVQMCVCLSLTLPPCPSSFIIYSLLSAFKL